VNVVDSSAWVAYFEDERNADVFAPIIERYDQLLVPSLSLTEVFKFICRNRDETTALNHVAQMQQGVIVPLDDNLALQAAEFGLSFRLPLADSVIFATARRFDATLWTQDADFEGLPGVQYFPRSG
jgi:predicted nucleic acid-binding protein